MELTCVIILFLISVCNCICEYKNHSKSLMCEGYDIIYFPYIISDEIKYNTAYIQIINTSISSLPSFDDYSNLKELYIWGNLYQVCVDVSKLQESYNVSSDCFKVDKTIQKINYDDLFSLFILLIIIPTAIIIKYYKSIIKSHDDNKKVENVV